MVVAPAGKAGPSARAASQDMPSGPLSAISRSIVAGSRDKAIQTEMVAFSASSSTVGTYSIIARGPAVAPGDVGDDRLQIEIAVGDVEEDDAAALHRAAIDLRAPRG